MSPAVSFSPRSVFKTVVAFPPNRHTMGGTSYLILENSGNILVDCPAWTDAIQPWLADRGGVRWLVITHRDAMADVKALQQALHCQVVVQEQEAYLLPDVTVTPFQFDFQLSPTTQAIWTPGYSPGSACVYHADYGGLLFTGRHLLPNLQGDIVPLRIAKTFHWRRQVASIQALRDRFSTDTLQHLCPGANTGFLRGQRSIDRAYDRLAQIDLTKLIE